MEKYNVHEVNAATYHTHGGQNKNMVNTMEKYNVHEVAW